jgi:hypothetical protein
MGYDEAVIQRILPLRRLFIWVLSGFAIFTFGVFLFVQLNERVTRLRAERLYADIRNLELKGGSWRDAQPVLD